MEGTARRTGNSTGSLVSLPVFSKPGDVLMLCWSETIAWYDGYDYTGHTLSRKSDHWQLVVKAVGFRGQRMVKIIKAPTMADCVILFNYSLRSTTHDRWKPDRYFRGS